MPEIAGLNEALRVKLLAMSEHDLRVRSELAATGELFGGYNERMAGVHRENAEKLELIIEGIGWPGVSMVGKDGAEAAWLVLQHAIGSPSLQRKCLPILEAAAQTGEAPSVHFACLEDRIRVFEGRPQRYGTQFDWNESGMLSPQPIEEPDRVDSHRASVGLGPMSERIQEVRQQAAAEGHEPPADFKEYQAAREAWVRSVGWR